MRWLVSTSLRLRVLVVVLMIILLIVGIQIVSNIPLDVFPEFAPPLVEIQTEVPGLSTTEVEALVTVPIEYAMNGTPWLQTIRSKSVLGLSSVVLLFEDGTDLMQARQLVQERLSRVSTQLPAVAKTPVMLSPVSSTSRVLKIGLSSKKLSQMEMTTLAKWTIRPRLMAVPGVANVAIWGQRDRQIQVLLDPDRLLANNITLNEVKQAAGDATVLAGGGFLDTPNQRMPVSHISPVNTPQELARIIVAFRNGAYVRIGAVAEVVEGFPAPIGEAVINDAPGILLIVEKQPWANTLEVTRNVESTLEALRPGLGDLEIDPTIFRPASFIEMSIQNLNRALLIGCILVVMVLALFLYNWRTALISAIALPTSLVIAALVLNYRGGTINTMVLAGLVIALGELVDDAIISVENIMRRLKLNRMAGNPESAFKIVLNATIEVRSAVIYGSLVVVLVLMPVFMLTGLTGTFFKPLAFSYVLAIIASLFVALTLTPALSLLILPKAVSREKDAPIVILLKKRYQSILPTLIKRPRRVILLLVGILCLSLLIVPLLGEEFLPNFKEYDFLMHWVEKPGTSIEAMERITEIVSRELRSIPGVRNFGAHIGRAEVADEVVGPNFTELWISVDPEVDYESTVAQIQEVVDGYPGLYRDVLTYLRERIKEVLTGSSATIVIRIYGPDLTLLEKKAQEVGEVIANIDGVVDLKVQPQTLVPQIEVKFRPEAASQFGLVPGDIRQAATTLIKGTKVGEIYEEQKIFDVVVWGVPQVRHDIGSVHSLMIDVPTGGQVPLGDVAEVYIAPTPNEITREASSRCIDVTCNVRGRDLGSVAREIERAVKSVPFETGYHPEILGEYAERQQSRNRLLGLAVLSLIGIFLLLYTDFVSVRLASLMLLSVPFALTGCIISTLLSGGVLSLGSMIGFVTVLGIAARNSIMLISHYRHLETEEGMPFGRELIMRGASERLSPILMTALTTALALLPIVIGGNRPGQEIEHPMAVVILGGLFTSTILNLLFLPALYLRFGRKN
ncbi:efflux RND transporter permease subunit [candidate division KSB1 bacterium]